MATAPSRLLNVLADAKVLSIEWEGSAFRCTGSIDDCDDHCRLSGSTVTLTAQQVVELGAELCLLGASKLRGRGN